jgi:hypothetical protein
MVQEIEHLPILSSNPSTAKIKTNQTNNNNKKRESQSWWFMPVVPALRNYIVRLERERKRERKRYHLGG